MKGTKDFLFWEEKYTSGPVEKLPWYLPGIDPDIDLEIARLKIEHGTVLDIGTGPGTQAAELARRGFTVTATDISKAAIEHAKKLAPSVTFKVDDIVHTKLKDSFDLIIDRGCFHVLPPKYRPVYVENMRHLLKPSGVLLLKTFSKKQPEADHGPYRFSAEEVEEVFGTKFKLRSCRHTEYQGTLDQPPRALIAVIVHRS